jgi:signal transduction histidine kinase
MKLASRMTLELGACALLVFGAAGFIQLRAEERDLRAVARNEALLLGRSLQTAFENALRDKQVEDVTETMGALSWVDPGVAIFVFDEDGHLVGASRNAQPSVDALRAERQARNQAEPVVEFASQVTPAVLRLGLRLRQETPIASSSIVLEKPLGELQRDLQTTRRDIVLTTLIFVATVAALMWFLARRYVGFPLASLVTNMKRVRAGDLRVAPVPQRTDEVGQTHEEFDRLVLDLEAARVRAHLEFEARRRIERGLQDADKLITLGQLSAVMAHEVGSPLQILEGRARALSKHADDATATRRTADMLVEQTQRIARIVNQMLSITRRRAPVRSSIDGEACVRSVLALLEIEARRMQVNFLLTRVAQTDVFADEDQLQQIALNLLRNALQASPAGSTVAVTLGGDSDNLVLEVRDAGTGIPESARERLFEPFFTTKASTGGTGLGLSVVKSIVQEHGGTVAFVEDGPRGCLVRVTLPRNVEVKTE